MTTVNNANGYCTLINVFTVAPEKQMDLVHLLNEASETVMSKLPGYVSASIHLGDDHKTVTNYAQWATLEDYQNALKNEDAMTHMKQAAAAAINFKPVTYSRIWTCASDDVSNAG